MSERRLCAALVLLGAGFVSPAALPASEAERKLSPRALYQALSKIPKARTVLPNGYQSPTIGPVPPSAASKRHHAVGAVAIGLSKPGTFGARILYIVFPTHADALADWNEAAHALPENRLTPPSVFPKPSAMFNVPVTTGKAPNRRTFGTTTLAFVTGNLIIEVDTSSTSSTTRGDILGTIALAQFAGSHLASVAKPAAPVKPVKPAVSALPVV